MRHAKGGFTLVELMIVVAIIGILAAVAIPKFAQMLEKSREGATKGNLGAIRSAASNYYADQQGQYPKTLDTASWTISTTSATNAFPGFIPQYITVISPVKVTGLDRIDLSKPHVYAVNHASALDIPVLYVYLPFQFRIVFKKELLAYPVVGWQLKRSGQVCIDQQKR